MHNITTETCFVARSGGVESEVNTGNCAEFTDWESGTRGEAGRIAAGLGGVVREEVPDPLKEIKWADGGTERVARMVGRLKLAVVVDDVVVARVYATERLP